MATFKMDKTVGEIEQPELLPDDWYVCRIVGQPKQMPNSKKKAGLSEEEGAGDNIVLRLRVQHANPKWNGRPFTKWLGVPNSADKESYDEFSGMKVEDVKLLRIAQWAAAFAGTTIENMGKKKNIDFEPGSEALVYITQGFDNREGHEDELVNSLDFNSVPRPVE